MAEDQNNNINKKGYYTNFIQALKAKLADLKLAITFLSLLLFFVYKYNIEYSGINWYRSVNANLHIHSLFDVCFYSSPNITLNVFGS